MKNGLVALGFVALVLSTSIVGAQSKPALAKPGNQDGKGPGNSKDVARLTRVSVHAQKGAVSVDITCSRPITPTPTMVSDPTRLVLDFADTISANLQNRITVNQDGLKSVRIGVQAMTPPTTRVVLDLEQARSYQLVADGNRLTVKLGQEDQASAPASDATTGQQDSSANNPDSTPAPPAAKQGSALPLAAAGQAGLAAVPAEPAVSKESSSGKDADSSEPMPLPGPAAGSQETVPPPAATSPAANDPSRLAMSFVSPAPHSEATAKTATEFKTAAPLSDPGVGMTAPAGNKNSDHAAQQSPARETGDAPKPAQVSSGTETKSSAPANLSVPASVKAEHLSLAAAKTMPDLPVPTVASKPPAAPTIPGDYVIGEQDVLSIVVWKERELSATVVVRPDGKITLPLVNEIKVIGMTPTQLQALLTDKFKPFLMIPQVTVEVVQINSRKAYLIGEVNKTGTFPLNSSTTVLQIIAEAGGLRDFAKRKDIYILRNQKGQQVRYRFNYDEVIRGKNTQQNIVLQPGDMVVVP